MGYYIETGTAKGKADILCEEYGLFKATRVDAIRAMTNGFGVVVVIDNGAFEAAGFAYSMGELLALGDDDYRHKQFLVGDRTVLAEAANCRE